MKQKTAIRQLIETNDEMRHAMQLIQNFIEDGYKDQASLKEAWNLISEYVTRSESLESVNEQHIKEAYLFGNHSEIKIGNPQIEAANIYYNETFEKP